jgi:hypothetical protein
VTHIPPYLPPLSEWEKARWLALFERMAVKGIKPWK